jgi:hypothetical protein
MGAGGIHLDGFPESLLVDQRLEYAVRGWRAAYIAHANEEDFYWFSIGHNSLNLFALVISFTVKGTRRYPHQSLQFPYLELLVRAQ